MRSSGEQANVPVIKQTGQSVEFDFPVNSCADFVDSGVLVVDNESVAYTG
ncbi:hypothetical protein [Stieleria marina]